VERPPVPRTHSAALSWYNQAFLTGSQTSQ
jgi:hypothetical protein